MIRTAGAFLGMVLAAAVPALADEQLEEYSTRLPPDIGIATMQEPTAAVSDRAGRDAAAMDPPAPAPPAQEQLGLPEVLGELLELLEGGFDPDSPTDEGGVEGTDETVVIDAQPPSAPEPETETETETDEGVETPDPPMVSDDDPDPVAEPPVEPAEDVGLALDDEPEAETAVPAADGPLRAESGSSRPGDWGPPEPHPDTNQFGTAPFALLGSEVAPGTRERLYWTTGQSFSGSVMETPVVVVHGVRRGPRLCLTGGVHGDELNGIEVVRRLAYRIEPEQLAGTVIAVPIVNLLGFSRGSRYLPDRRDLNRFFPGSPYGSSASRIAHSFFSSIIDHCDALVDIHTGSLDRANLPQVRGDLTNPLVLEFTRGFGATAVLHSPGMPGMLRHAASIRNIPATTFEIGAPMRLQPEEIEHGVQAIETLLNKMGMIEQRRRWREPQAVFYESRWVRVDHGGMLFSNVALGDRVTGGQRLGRVIDPVSNRAADVFAPEAGRIIGMALNQLVLPGFAAYNLGIAASEEQVVIDAVQDADPDDERYMEHDQLDEDRRPVDEADVARDRERVSERDSGYDDD